MTYEAIFEKPESFVWYLLPFVLSGLIGANLQLDTLSMTHYPYEFYVSLSRTTLHISIQGTPPINKLMSTISRTIPSLRTQTRAILTSPALNAALLPAGAQRGHLARHRKDTSGALVLRASRLDNPYWMFWRSRFGERQESPTWRYSRLEVPWNQVRLWNPVLVTLYWYGQLVGHQPVAV